MRNEVIAAGLRLKTADNYWKSQDLDRVPYKSLAFLWHLLEQFPIRRLSYKGNENTSRRLDLCFCWILFSILISWQAASREELQDRYRTEGPRLGDSSTLIPPWPSFSPIPRHMACAARLGWSGLPSSIKPAWFDLGERPIRKFYRWQTLESTRGWRERSTHRTSGFYGIIRYVRGSLWNPLFMNVLQTKAGKQSPVMKMHWIFWPFFCRTKSPRKSGSLLPQLFRQLLIVPSWVALICVPLDLVSIE